MRTSLRWLAAFVLGWSAASLATLPVGGVARAEDEARFGEPWSEERQAAALGAGRPVLVVFTAQSCFSCEAYEREFVFTEAVRTAVKKHDAAVLVADLTERSGEQGTRILEELRRHGRAGVPLYVVLSPQRCRRPIVFETLTSSKQVVDALRQAVADPPPPYRAVPPDTTRGAIEGTVRLARAIDIPRLRRPKACEREPDFPWTERAASILSFHRENLTLADCVVSLRRIAEGKDWTREMRDERRTITLVARDGLLGPFVQWARTGTGVDIGNDLGASQLNVKGLFTTTTGGPAALQWNVMLSTQALLRATDDTRLPCAGLYTAQCDCSCFRHMHAQILAFDHPYVHGPTAIDGRYALEDVPPGDYEVVCWHGPFTLEALGQPDGRPTYRFGPPFEVVHKVTVPPRGRVTADFTLDPPR